MREKYGARLVILEVARVGKAIGKADRASCHIAWAKDRPLTSFWFSKIDPWLGA
jgi:hypothetical protein